jgi:hypothetical protein
MIHDLNIKNNFKKSFVICHTRNFGEGATAMALTLRKPLAPESGSKANCMFDEKK